MSKILLTGVSLTINDVAEIIGGGTPDSKDLDNFPKTVYLVNTGRFK